ncbi:MAG: protein TolR [Rickettsiaceae bacterium]|nr:protein TolR [Rickettsiaceae bacterium]
MAMHIQGRSSGRRSKRLMSEINVTPMVDVMLVLLIIFMITAPMLVSSIEVDLPKTELPANSGQDKPLEVTLNKKGELYLEDTLIKKTDLIKKLKIITKEKNDTKIFVRGDKNIFYGDVIDLMSYIHSAGYSKVALVTDIKTK